MRRGSEAAWAARKHSREESGSAAFVELRVFSCRPFAVSLYVQRLRTEASAAAGRLRG